MIKKKSTLIALVIVFLVAGTVVSCGDSATTTETTVTSDTTMPVGADTMSMPADTTTFTDSATTRPTKTPD
jgi:hypothetical protein